LKQKIGKLAALVDHYYGAYHEAAKLLAAIASSRRYAANWRQSRSYCLGTDELDLKARLLTLRRRARALTVALRP
jgi:hypothetical protein